MAVVVSSFNLMGLPLELRRHIYQFALPAHCQTALPKNGQEWVDDPSWNEHKYNPDHVCQYLHNCLSPAKTWSKIPNQCMSLLLVNRQISHEARNVIYSNFCPTIFLEYGKMTILNKVQRFEDFLPVPIFHSLLHYVTHWQINLGYYPAYRFESNVWNSVDESSIWQMTDDMSPVCYALSRASNLKSVKVKMDCFCLSEFWLKHATTQDPRMRWTEFDMRFMMQHGLDPSGKVEYELRQTFRPLRWLPQSTEVVILVTNSEQTTQCQELACHNLATALAKSMRKFKGYPNDKEVAWINLKREAACLEHDLRKHVLKSLWESFKTDSLAEFSRKINACLETRPELLRKINLDGYKIDPKLDWMMRVVWPIQ